MADWYGELGERSCCSRLFHARAHTTTLLACVSHPNPPPPDPLARVPHSNSPPTALLACVPVGNLTLRVYHSYLYTPTYKCVCRYFYALVVKTFRTRTANSLLNGGVMYKLCIVEDDSEVAFQLQHLLVSQGYQVYVVRTLHSLDAALDEIFAQQPHLLLLDLGLPGVDGQVLCRALREKSSVPIIVVTSRNSQLDELMLLTMGADDFVAKPYNPQLLLARIERVLNRVYANSSGTSSILRHKSLVLNLSTCTISHHENAPVTSSTAPSGTSASASANGGASELASASAANTSERNAACSTATLTKNEMKILALLMRNAGVVVPRQRIQEELWQTDEFIDDNTLTVNISHVRQILDRIGAQGAIVTHRGIGYCLV